MTHMTVYRLVAPFLVVLLGVAALASRGTHAQGEPYDLVLSGGRVLDPETGLDATRNVGIQRGRIAAVTADLVAARETLDVHGLVVAPGFIDLHVHGQDSESYRYYSHDGVTTALELEIGTYPVAPWYAEREGHALINYGVSVGHPGARRALLAHDESLPGVAVIYDSSRGWTNGALPEADLPRLDSLVERGLAQGALAVGFGLAYTPGASREEILRLFQVAARHSVPCFVHLREGGRDATTGGSVGALQEVIADAAVTGASLHVVHVTSMGQRDTPLLLELIRGARERGLDVTTEAYPYTAASTAIQSAVFDAGWQQRMGITYRDILYPPTGERLTAASFARLRRQGGRVVFFIIPDSTVRQAVADPLVMIASDGGSAHAHPRLAGTHARVLGRYARDSSVLSLMDAVRKMTLMPAQRLERVVPAMRAKGRVQVGADADLTVFDAARVVDRATYERPAQFSDGIVHVLVNGVFVVRNGASVAGYPGRAIRRSP
jgi:cytosine/adenosine deaminase-related metal-dependent hydrolase